jgi:hypothetical protein
MELVENRMILWPIFEELMIFRWIIGEAPICWPWVSRAGWKDRFKLVGFLQIVLRNSYQQKSFKYHISGKLYKTDEIWLL